LSFQTIENSDASVEYTFLKKDRLAFDLWKWCLFLVLILR